MSKSLLMVKTLPLLKYDKNSKTLSGCATAKHITDGGNGKNAGVNQLHGKKQLQGGKKEKHGNYQGTQTGEQPTHPPQQQKQQQQPPQNQGGKPPFKW